MRPIDPTLKARILQAQQTLYNNADPRMEVLALRPTTAIRRAQFWQESIVTAGATATCTSVAIRRQGSRADRAYVAYVAGGVLTVKSAAVVIPSSRMVWVTETTIPDCQACALEFEGRFVHIGSNVEFRTDALPYLFYVTTAGALLGGLLGGPYESLASANVTAVDAINGVSNTFDAQNQGFFVFYIVNGTVYYNTYLDGAWLGQQAVSMAPANAVRIKAERTFDYRIVLQVEDSSGALWEVFTKMESTGWNGTDFISLGVSVQTAMFDVHYSDYANTENISLDVAVDAWNMATYSPTLIRAWNIPTSMEDPENPGTYYDDYGYRVVFEFDECIRNATSFPADFKLTDAYNATWHGQSVEQEYHSRFVIVTFNDFNNAGNSITATALAGNLWNGLTMLTETAKTFTATGLVPTSIPAPLLTGVTNVDSRTIRLAFDRPIISIGAQTGFLLTGVEPFCSPAGELVPTTYGIDDITMADAPTVAGAIALAAGTLTEMEVV